MSAKKYWRRLFRESQIATHLVLGGILVTYVGTALSKEGLTAAGIPDFLGLLLMIYLFVKFTFAFPRDGLGADLHPALALSLQVLALAVIIGATAYSASNVGLNGKILASIQSMWVALGLVDFVTASQAEKIGTVIHD